MKTSTGMGAWTSARKPYRTSVKSKIWGCANRAGTAPCAGEGLLKVNVGCGLAPIPGYVNLDNSPSLLVQSNPILRRVTNTLEWLVGIPLYTRFPPGVSRHDVRKGLPFGDNSVEVFYTSHLLEHLPRDEAENVLREAYRAMVPGGLLRIALPDLERKARCYLRRVELARRGKYGGNPADEFLESCLLGTRERSSWRPRELFRRVLGREGHCWMYDGPSLVSLLRKIGFREVRECAFRESRIAEVRLLDLESRRDESFYVEASK